MCAKWYFNIGKDRVWYNGNALRVVLLATTNDSAAHNIISGFYHDFETPQLQPTYLHRSMTNDKEYAVRINIAHTDIAMHKVYQSNRTQPTVYIIHFESMDELQSVESLCKRIHFDGRHIRNYLLFGHDVDKRIDHKK
eukprot:199863_1